jgi:hypothetical protein
MCYYKLLKCEIVRFRERYIQMLDIGCHVMAFPDAREIRASWMIEQTI